MHKYKGREREIERHRERERERDRERFTERGTERESQIATEGGKNHCRFFSMARL